MINVRAKHFNELMEYLIAIYTYMINVSVSVKKGIKDEWNCNYTYMINVRITKK